MRARADYVPPRSKSPGVYFVWAPDVGLVKIGITGSQAAMRVDAMQGMSPVPLYLVAVIKGADYDTEAHLHKKLRPHNEHGEWFRFTPQVAWEMEPFMVEGAELRERDGRIIVTGVGAEA